MGAWTKNKVESLQINGGQEYTISSNPSLEQLNAITNNSFYAVDKADEALEKANSAFENNGTVVSVGGSPVANLSFTSDPQQQIGEINTTNISQALEISGLHTTMTSKANKDLSNVTYPQVVADGVARIGAGDRVIERWVAKDGKSWYEIYESGWKKCGGIHKMSADGTEETVTLPDGFEFASVNYFCRATALFATFTGDFERGAFGCHPITNKTISVSSSRVANTGDYAFTCYWTAEGC